jgi:hypothetical protein
MRLLEKAQEISAVSIAVSKVVNVDIENLKIEVNSGFNLTREI